MNYSGGITALGTTELQQILLPYQNGKQIAQAIAAGGGGTATDLQTQNAAYPLTSTLQLGSTYSMTVRAPLSDSEVANKSYVDSHVSTATDLQTQNAAHPLTSTLQLGGTYTMTVRTPLSDSEVANKSYVDSHVSTATDLQTQNAAHPLLSDLVFSNGKTLVTRTPTLPDETATKRYVDESIGSSQPLNITNLQHPLSNDLDFSASAFKILVPQGLIGIDSKQTIQGKQLYSAIDDLQTYVADRYYANTVPLNLITTATGNIDCGEQLVQNIATALITDLNCAASVDYVNTAISNITPGVLPNLNELVVLKPTESDWSNSGFNIAIGTATLDAHALNKTAGDALYLAADTVLNQLPCNNDLGLSDFEIVQLGPGTTDTSATTVKQVQDWIAAIAPTSDESLDQINTRKALQNDLDMSLSTHYIMLPDVDRLDTSTRGLTQGVNYMIGLQLQSDAIQSAKAQCYLNTVPLQSITTATDIVQAPYGIIVPTPAVSDLNKAATVEYVNNRIPQNQSLADIAVSFPSSSAVTMSQQRVTNVADPVAVQDAMNFQSTAEAISSGITAISLSNMQTPATSAILCNLQRIGNVTGGTEAGQVVEYNQWTNSNTSIRDSITSQIAAISLSNIEAMSTAPIFCGHQKLVNVAPGDEAGQAVEWLQWSNNLAAKPLNELVIQYPTLGNWSNNAWRITGVDNGQDDTDVVNKFQLDHAAYYKNSDSLDKILKPVANMDFSGVELLNIQYPNQSTSGANMQYVQDYAVQNSMAKISTLATINASNPIQQALDLRYGYPIWVSSEVANLYPNDLNVLNTIDIKARDDATLVLSKSYTDAHIPEMIQYQNTSVTCGPAGIDNATITLLNQDQSGKGYCLKIPKYQSVAANQQAMTLDCNIGTISSKGFELKDASHYPLLLQMTQSARANIFVPASFVDTLINNLTTTVTNLSLSSVKSPTGDITLSGFRIKDVANFVALTDALNVSSGDSRYATTSTPLSSFAVPVSALTMNSQKLSNLASPTNSSDAANKAYVDLPHLSISNTASCSVNCATTNSVIVIANGNQLCSFAQAIGQTTSPCLMLVPDKFQVQSQLNSFSFVGGKAVSATGQLTSFYIGSATDDPTKTHQVQLVIGNGTSTLPAFSFSSMHTDIGLGSQTAVMTIGNQTGQSAAVALLLSPGIPLSDATIRCYTDAGATLYPIQTVFDRRTGYLTDIQPLSASSLEFASVKTVTAMNTAQTMANLSIPLGAINCNSQLLNSVGTAIMSSVGREAVNCKLFSDSQNLNYWTATFSLSTGLPIIVGGASTTGLIWTTNSPGVYGPLITGCITTQLYAAYSTEVVITVANGTINLQNTYDITASISSAATTQAQKLIDGRAWVGCCSYLSSTQISCLLSQFQSSTAAVYLTVQFRKKQW